jgi:hypothetical protein
VQLACRLLAVAESGYAAGSCLETAAGDLRADGLGGIVPGHR